MRILVTGGSGFIGSHLVRRLRQKHEVAVLIHNSLLDEPVRKFRGDILKKESLSYAFYDFQPEIVFHLAAQPIVRNSCINRELDYDTIMTNMMGTLNILDVVMGTKSIKKVIHISTDKVFGDIDYIQQTSCLLGTKHPYNASKLAGDILAQMFASYYSIPTTIVRHGNVYGDGDFHWDRIIPRTIHRIHNNESPVIRGKETSRDYIHIDDIVDAYLKIMNCNSIKNPFVVHLGSKLPYTTQYVVDEILKLMGRVDLPVECEPAWTGEIPNQHIETTLGIGWKPSIGFDDGLKRTVEWYKNYLENKND